MAAMASAVGGMSAVCHKEGTGPCKCYATYFVAHITASIFINDDERGLHADRRKPSAFSLKGLHAIPGLRAIPSGLEELALHEPISRYRHGGTGHLLRPSPASTG
jgi:hypothetical protein